METEESQKIGFVEHNNGVMPRVVERKKVKSLSPVQLFATPWTVPYQGPPSMGFSRQEYWSGLPFPPPKDLPDPEIKLTTTALQGDSLPLRHQGSPKLLYIPATYLLPPARGSTA